MADAHDPSNYRSQAEKQVEKIRDTFESPIKKDILKTINAGDKCDTIKDYAIFMLDPDGIVQTWNDGACELKGYSKDEIVGQHLNSDMTDNPSLSGTIPDLSTYYTGGT